MFAQIFQNLFGSPKKNMYYLSLFKNDNLVYGYSIHGLWPDYGNGTYPQYCKKVHFDIQTLKPIMDDLICYWPEDKGKREGSFWRHEYEKHGSCVFSEMTEYDYFKKVLDLYHSVMKMGLKMEDFRKGEKYMIPYDENFNILV